VVLLYKSCVIVVTVHGVTVEDQQEVPYAISIGAKINDLG